MRAMNSLTGGWEQATTVVARYGALVLLIAGVLLLIALMVLVIRGMRRGRLDNVGTWIAVAIATGFSAEGMWEVAREGLGLPVATALALFAVAEAAMTSEAIRARRRYQRTGHPGPHGLAVWVIAASAGVIAALNADSLVEIPVRLGIPVLAAALWWLELTSDGTRRPADAITWRISPRRVLVWLRLAEPGARDVIEVDRARRVQSLTVAAHRFHHSRSELLRRWHAARLRRLALAADDAMVAEARARVDRVHRIAALTAPGQPHPGAEQPADRTPDTTSNRTPDRTPDRTSNQTSTRTAKRTRVRTPSPTETAAAIARMRTAHPDMPAVRIADKLGLSERTVRRHLTRARQAHQPTTGPAEQTEPASEQVAA